MSFLHRVILGISTTPWKVSCSTYNGLHICVCVLLFGYSLVVCFCFCFCFYFVWYFVLFLSSGWFCYCPVFLFVFEKLLKVREDDKEGLRGGEEYD